MIVTPDLLASRLGSRLTLNLKIGEADPKTQIIHSRGEYWMVQSAPGLTVFDVDSKEAVGKAELPLYVGIMRRYLSKDWQ